MSIYFDYAATTPVDQRVLAAMKPYFGKTFGNPSSLHFFGQEALAAIDRAREKISGLMGANFREIIFTGSATEANNLAMRGVILNAKKIIDQPRIIVSSIEHESVLETVKDLEKEGVEVVYLPVDRNGKIDLEILKKSLNERTVLVSVMYANNEIGIIQPIREISQIIRNWKLKIENYTKTVYPLFHTDAVQAFQFLDCNAGKLGVDLMTLSAHKIYGPKGIGLLYIKEGINHNGRPARNIITGGGQEFGLRSGTENVPAIVGFGKAAEITAEIRGKETKKVSALRDYFGKNLEKIFPKIQTNADFARNKSDFLPNILNIYFPGHRSDDLLTRLDLAGVAVSSGSACSSRATEPSYVIQAMGYSRERARESLRFSFGRQTSKTEIDKSLKIIKKLKI